MKISELISRAFLYPAFGFGWSSGIATQSPATVDTQAAKNTSLIGTIIAGTPAIIQAIKQPTSFYQPATAGTSAGSSSGASQSDQEQVPTWAWWALGGAALAALAAGVLAVRK